MFLKVMMNKQVDFVVYEGNLDFIDFDFNGKKRDF